MTRSGRWLTLAALLTAVTILGDARPGMAAGLVEEIKQRGTMRFCVADWPYLT